MSEFSLELNEDQLQLQKWVHDFAENVIRPAAHEWDEREETPWPILEEAAKIGLYGWEFMAELLMNDPTGLSSPVALEELFWGDAGIGMSIMASGLAAAGIAASGTSEQVIEWVPQCYGDADNVQLGAFAASEPDAGSDVGGYRTRAVYDEATDEWVLNGTKAWISNGGIANIHVVIGVVDPALGAKGHAVLHRSAQHARPQPGAEVQEARPASEPHRRSGARRCSRSGSLPPRRQGQTRRAPRQGARGQAQSLPGRHANIRGHPPGGRLHGGRNRPGGL